MNPLQPTSLYADFARHCGVVADTGSLPFVAMAEQGCQIADCTAQKSGHKTVPPQKPELRLGFLGRADHDLRVIKLQHPRNTQERIQGGNSSPLLNIADGLPRQASRLGQPRKRKILGGAFRTKNLCDASANVCDWRLFFGHASLLWSKKVDEGRHKCYGVAANPETMTAKRNFLDGQIAWVSPRQSGQSCGNTSDIRAESFESKCSSVSTVMFWSPCSSRWRVDLDTPMRRANWAKVKSPLCFLKNAPSCVRSLRGTARRMALRASHIWDFLLTPIFAIN